jgi:nucleoid-associated protein YgaU
VEPGYTISAIAEAYRQEGYSITTQDILEANPQISDPRRIKVGDVIIIPIKW